MNKQAITFLSLFSLILVLSVYYMMLPPTSIDNKDVEIVNTDSSIYNFTKMELELTAKRDGEIKQNNEIIADVTSSTEEVNQALQGIQTIKNKNALEQEIKDSLASSGYENAFIEIDGTTIKVTIAMSNSQTQDATRVINIVLEKVGSDYTPEVKFVSE